MKLTKKNLYNLIEEALDLKSMATQSSEAELDDDYLFQMMTLLSDAEEDPKLNNFVREYEKLLGQLESIGGAENIDKMSDEQKTILYHMSDDLQWHRTTAERFLKEKGYI